jgi:NADPH-dependent curcumin reductase CurA
MKNRRIILKSRPVGIPQPNHFELDTAVVPGLEDGEFLVENIFLSVDPAQRGYVNEENNYAPPVAIGAVMRALAVGRVRETRHPDYVRDQYLYGWFGWQDYCVCRPAAVLRRVNPEQAPLSTAAGLLGINGLTAYLALENIGNLEAGETVVVTAAAGAVGSIVGQLAKLKGCRPIAIVGSEHKGAQCVADFGYSGYANYHHPLEPKLQELCPDGIDVFFDNVSGTIADAILGKMAWFGRVIQCGTVSIASWVPVPQGPRVAREVLTRRLRMEGFVIFDHGARFDAVAAELARLLATGALRIEEDIESGIERAPQALADVYAGRNRGKKLIQLKPLEC